MKISCYCGSNEEYDLCCHPFVGGKKLPVTPEQLMRSRYSAYAQGIIDYIIDTMSGKALSGFVKSSAKQWADSVIWLGLKVINSYNETKEHGFVEFSAKFMQKNNKLQEIHELSEFICVENKWFYIDGKHLPATDKLVNRKIPLNNLCPCGSGRKFKSCHHLLNK